MGQKRKIRYRLMAWRRFPELRGAAEEIDVIIPIVAKDLHILPLCLEGVRRGVAHPVRDIYIVAPQQPEIVAFCQKNSLRFVEETSVLGIGPRDLNLQIALPDGHVRDRSGWLFQQLVKLSGKVGTCRYYLCIDADHVLIRPHVFLNEEHQQVFYMSYEEHQPYYDNIHRLLPGLPLDKLSYVDHKMLFDRQQLARLHAVLAESSVHKQPSSVISGDGSHTAVGGDGSHTWVDAILASYDRRCEAGFSEFELYGNFITDKVQRPWLQKRLPYRKLADYETLRRKYSRSRWSLTFPDYMRQNR